MFKHSRKAIDLVFKCGGRVLRQDDLSGRFVQTSVPNIVEYRASLGKIRVGGKLDGRHYRVGHVKIVLRVVDGLRDAKNAVGFKHGVAYHILHSSTTPQLSSDIGSRQAIAYLETR